MPAESLDFSKANVLVVGDLMLDRYWHGPTNRISPEAPVPVVRISEQNERPGGAGNVALNIVSLGAKATLAANIGDDADGVLLEQLLTERGVNTLLGKSSHAPTIVKLRVLSQHQQLIRLDFESEQGPEQQLTPQLHTLLRSSDVLVLSDYAKGTLARPEGLLAAAREAGCFSIVDPKGSDFTPYRGADLLTPNLREFEAVVGDCGDDNILQMRAEALVQALELGALLITRGEAGMTLMRAGEEAVHMPAQAREVYDVTGAGDTVCATLAAAIANGADLVRACRLANIAAGIVVGKVGTESVSAAEIERAAQSQEIASDVPVSSHSSLFDKRRGAAAAGERVVFTNGCFDVLHAGHVRYLREARALGDRLIVAVNSDASVTRLKGEGRPVVPLDQRMAVLAALGSVDWVVSFDEDTPLELIRALAPDVLVKGGDYDESQIVGADVVRAYGGRVQTLAFVEGVSSSAIIARAAVNHSEQDT